MKKFLIIFLALFLFACENNSQKVAENPKAETEKVVNISENAEKIPETGNISQSSEWEILISDNFIVTSTKSEDDFSKNLSKDKVILHLFLSFSDEGQDGNVYHFLSLKDFYDFLPMYTENLKKWNEYKAKFLAIDSYGLFEDWKETKDLYSEKTLTDIFAILEKYPDLENSLDIRIEDEFLEYEIVKKWYEKFLKK